MTNYTILKKTTKRLRSMVGLWWWFLTKTFIDFASPGRQLVSMVSRWYCILLLFVFTYSLLWGIAFKYTAYVVLIFLIFFLIFIDYERKKYVGMVPKWYCFLLFLCIPTHCYKKYLLDAQYFGQNWKFTQLWLYDGESFLVFPGRKWVSMVPRWYCTLYFCSCLFISMMNQLNTLNTLVEVANWHNHGHMMVWFFKNYTDFISCPRKKMS